MSTKFKQTTPVILRFHHCSNAFVLPILYTYCEERSRVFVYICLFSSQYAEKKCENFSAENNFNESFRLKLPFFGKSLLLLQKQCF